MTNNLEIKCAKNFDTSLRVARSPASLQTEEETENLRISVKSNHINVWHWVICNKKLLAEFFQKMSLHWKGWEGEFFFNSDDKNLELTASSDRLGHITLEIKLSSPNRNFNVWKLETFILIQAGQLEGIEKALAGFLYKSE